MTVATGECLAHFDARVAVTLRRTHASDLRSLEWFGTFTAHRAFIARAFDRQERGEVLMLVAIAGGFPVGQLWVDLTRKAAAGIGVLWALRVLPPLRGSGIGTRLLRLAEAQLRDRGFRVGEIGVERDNPDARRLYERMGYVVSGAEREVEDYVTPDGGRERMDVDQWILHKALLRDEATQDGTR